MTEERRTSNKNYSVYKSYNNNNNDDTIDLLRLAKVLLRNVWLIVAVALLFGCGAYAGTKLLVTPTYRSSFTAYVNNRTAETQAGSTVSTSDISASRSLVTTYSAILTSRSLLREAMEATELGQTYQNLSDSALASFVSTETVDDTEIIQVNVTMDDPQAAEALANAIAEVAPTYISTVVEGSSMQIIETPLLPTSSYSPNYLKNTVYGLLLGAVLAVGVLVLRELIDDRVRSAKELEDRYGIAVMGTIPDLVAARKKSKNKKNGAHDYSYA